MGKTERHNWILKQVQKRERVDVLSAEFVDEYIDATGAVYSLQYFGAFTCRQLGRDLSEMWRNGLLTRSRIGLSGFESGFPKWVYVYELAK